jgi:hypothetical protein
MRLPSTAPPACLQNWPFDTSGQAYEVGTEQGLLR